MAKSAELRRRTSVPAAEAKAPDAPTTNTMVLSTAKGGHLGVSLVGIDGVGIEVVHAHPQDLCFKAGLRTGMVITAVDGKALEDHEACLQALEAAKAAKTDVEVTYLTAEQAVAERERVQQAEPWFNWRMVMFVVFIFMVVIGRRAFQAYMMRGAPPMMKPKIPPKPTGAERTSAAVKEYMSAVGNLEDSVDASEFAKSAGATSLADLPEYDPSEPMELFDMETERSTLNEEIKVFEATESEGLSQGQLVTEKHLKGIYIEELRDKYIKCNKFVDCQDPREGRKQLRMLIKEGVLPKHMQKKAAPAKTKSKKE